MWRESHRIVRPVASIVLTVLATLLLFPALVSNWARTHVYDGDQFADHAVAALEEPAVRDALVRRIVDEIIGVGPPETISIVPLIELVTTTVVNSITFVEIFRDAVEDLHEDLFERSRDSDPVALTLVDAMIVITAFIQQAYPEAAQQLPPDLTSSFIELRGRDWAVDVVTLGEDIEYFAFILPMLCLVLYAAAIWVSPNRRQTIAAIGFGCVAVAAVMVVGRDFAREWILDEVAFSDRAVSNAVWDAYTDSLQAWATLAGGMGLVLAVAASGRSHRVDVRKQWAWVQRVVSYSPQSSTGKILRATIFLVAGLMIIRESQQFFRLAVLLGGAYLLYYAISELIALAGPPRLRTGAERAAKPETRARFAGRTALRLGSFAMLVAASFSGVFITCQALETVEGDVQIGQRTKLCNGSEELCDKRLDEVAFLGTHNSMAAASESGWYFVEHYSGIPAQLESGVRALLIDTWYGYDTGGGVVSADRDFVLSKLSPELYSPDVIAAARRLVSAQGSPPEGQPPGTYLCHAYCELGATPFAPALRGINTFLEQNPGEVIFLFLQDQISPEDTAKAFISSGLVQRVYHHREGEPLPTLGEMIERDERVVVLADNNNEGVDWYLHLTDLVQETPFLARTPAQLSCDPNRGSTDNPIFVMNNWISASPPSPQAATVVNSYEFLSERVRRCERERGQMVNIIVVDWSEIGDAHLVVDVMNGIADPPGEEDIVERPAG